ARRARLCRGLRAGGRLGRAARSTRARETLRPQRRAHLSPPMKHTYFVTGALGCIGAWVVKQLVERGDVPVVFDLGGDPRRIRDLIGEEGLARVRFVQGDITDLEAVKRAVRAAEARALVHLAGLQVPFCKADPALGARVNVLGTIHVFEAAL